LKRPYNLHVPSSTDFRIEGLITEIRTLCRERFSPEAEAELKRLARELRLAIKQHVGMAKSSLGIKKAVINERDPDAPKKDLIV